jgi:hypothetical protein
MTISFGGHASLPPLPPKIQIRVDASGMQGITPCAKIGFGSTQKPGIVAPHRCIVERLPRPMHLDNFGNNLSFAPTS